MAAYKDSTLGHPILCPRERLSHINKSLIEKCRSTFYKPDRIVVAYAGIQHEEVVRLTEKYFGDMAKSTSPTLQSLTTESAKIDPSTPKLRYKHFSKRITRSPPEGQTTSSLGWHFSRCGVQRRIIQCSFGTHVSCKYLINNGPTPSPKRS